MRTRGFLLAVLATGIPVYAMPAVLIFNFDTIITGDTPGGSDIATLTITDVAPDTVEFMLSHNATSAPGQFITNLWFNLEPYVTMTQSNQTPANKFDGPLSQGSNTEQNAGLNFDASQAFVTSNSGGGVNRLKPGEFVTFTIAGAGIDALDFNATAPPTGGQRADVLAMIHLQGIEGGRSVKLGAVPEPASMTALAFGAALMLGRRRRK